MNTLKLLCLQIPPLDLSTYSDEFLLNGLAERCLSGTLSTAWLGLSPRSRSEYVLLLVDLTRGIYDDRKCVLIGKWRNGCLFVHWQ